MLRAKTQVIPSCSTVIFITIEDAVYAIYNIKSQYGETYYAHKRGSENRFILPNRKVKALLSIIDCLKKVE